MPNNKYKGLTVNQAVSLCDEEMKVFQDKWNEINEKDGYVAKMANEKSSLISTILRGDVLLQGVTTLKNLAQAHFEREKPGFFSMLFRTKKAQEYRSERKKINQLAKQLKNEMEKNNNFMYFTGKGQSIFSHLNIDGLTKNNEYFKDIAQEVDNSTKMTRANLKNKLNASDVNMQDAKDQIILNFLNECDTKMTEATYTVDEEFTRQVGESVKSGEKIETFKTDEKDIQPEPQNKKQIL